MHLSLVGNYQMDYLKLDSILVTRLLFLLSSLMRQQTRFSLILSTSGSLFLHHLWKLNFHATPSFDDSLQMYSIEDHGHPL